MTGRVEKILKQADKAYEIQSNVMQQQVVAEAVNVERVRKEGEIKVQEAEIARRERELAATVLKQADAERQKIQTLAEAERQRLALEATGRADQAAEWRQKLAEFEQAETEKPPAAPPRRRRPGRRRSTATGPSRRTARSRRNAGRK